MSTLETGNKAPDFSARNQNGETVHLSDFKGKKVILYFYPKDNTPGCTTEACNFRDNYQSLKKRVLKSSASVLIRSLHTRNLQLNMSFLFNYW